MRKVFVEQICNFEQLDISTSRHSIGALAYKRIICLFNDQNYWLNLRGVNLTRKGKTLDTNNKAKWLLLVQVRQAPRKESYIYIYIEVERRLLYCTVVFSPIIYPLLF